MALKHKLLLSPVVLLFFVALFIFLIAVLLKLGRVAEIDNNKKALKAIAKRILDNFKQIEQEDSPSESKKHNTEAFFNKGFEVQHLNFAILLRDKISKDNGEDKISISEAIELSQTLHEFLEKTNESLTKMLLQKIALDNPKEYENLKWLYEPTKYVKGELVFQSFVEIINIFAKTVTKI